jgi:hypothetical protein
MQKHTLRPQKVLKVGLLVVESENYKKKNI